MTTDSLACQLPRRWSRSSRDRGETRHRNRYREAKGAQAGHPPNYL